MSDASALSSVEGGYGSPDGAVLLPQFWDGYMARHGWKGHRGDGFAFLGYSDGVEWLIREMKREPLVKIALGFTAALITEGKHDLVPAVPKSADGHGNSAEQKRYNLSKKYADFTQSWMDAMPRRMKTVVRAASEGVYGGHKLFGKEWGVRDGYVVPVDYAPKPRTAYRMKVDRSNRLLGVVPADGSLTDADALIPATNLLVFSFDGEDGSPMGEPCAAAVYKAWQRKNVKLKDQAGSLKQAGGGFLLGKQVAVAGVEYVPTTKVKTGENPDGTPILKDALKTEIAAKTLGGLKSTGVGVLPLGMDASFLSSNAAEVFEAPLDRDDREIIMAFGLPARAILSSDANSQADAGEASGAAATVRDERRGIIEAIIDAEIRAVLALNFPDFDASLAPAYRITTDERGDLVAVGNFLAANRDWLTLDIANYFLSLVGAPEITDDQWEESKASAIPAATGTRSTDVQDEAAIDAQDRAGSAQEVAAFVATFLRPDGNDRLRLAA